MLSASGRQSPGSPASGTEIPQKLKQNLKLLYSFNLCTTVASAHLEVPNLPTLFPSTSHWHFLCLLRFNW